MLIVDVVDEVNEKCLNNMVGGCNPDKPQPTKGYTGWLVAILMKVFQEWLDDMVGVAGTPIQPNVTLPKRDLR